MRNIHFNSFLMISISFNLASPCDNFISFIFTILNPLSFLEKRCVIPIQRKDNLPSNILLIIVAYEGILLMVQKSGKHQLRLVVYTIIYRFFLHPRWCRISSINSMYQKSASLNSES